VASLLTVTGVPSAYGQLWWRRRAAVRVEAPTQRLDVGRLALAVHERTNAERVRARLQPLEWSPALATVAEQHSRDMAVRKYFSHQTKGLVRGQSFGERLRAAGIAGRRLAENIALLPVRMVAVEGPGEAPPQWAPDYDAMAREALRMWMRSAGHRRNILDGQLDSLGVGCWVGERSGLPYVYMTQNFGDLR